KRLDPGVQGVHLRCARRPPQPRVDGQARRHDPEGEPRRGQPGRRPGRIPERGHLVSATAGAPTELAIHHVDGRRRMGFFTDTTVCIGCKACEVACKQWNDLPADGSRLEKGSSYDHTGDLSASTWRHVRFVELEN